RTPRDSRRKTGVRIGVQFALKWGTASCPTFFGGPSMALTDTAIRGTKPGLKPFKLYDRDGLFLLINPAGSKLWRWRYRVGGREKLLALGEYPIVSLGEARERHLAARRVLATGTDPMAERKAQAVAKREEVKAKQREMENSFEAVARTWWAWWSTGK